MIRLENIHKSYRMGKNKLHVLKGINLHIKQGELVSFLRFGKINFTEHSRDSRQL